MPPREAYPRALAAAQRAVELDDSSAEAHLSLAFGEYWWSWKAVSAERDFKRALELNPNLVRAHHWYATFLFSNGRRKEALDHLEQARRLDPSSPSILADRAYFQSLTGSENEAIDQLTQLAATQPSLSSAHSYLALIYWRTKDYPHFLAESRTDAQLRHDSDGLALADAREKGFAANGLRGLYESELPVQKEQVDRGAGDAFSLAATYAALGQTKTASNYLQVSFDRHEPEMLSGDPTPELQNDPTYLQFRARVKQILAQ
jgi:tetratricopeptide (TPR) repeat protein